MSKQVFSNTHVFTPTQLPQLWRDEDPNFVNFLQDFFAWNESEGPGLKTRQLLQTDDIDDTDADSVAHWVKKYMPGVPVSDLGNKRFLQKHILDLYRSKGGVEGLRLLFRLLYHEEINYYVPRRDMLAPSYGVWKEPTYLEVSFTPENVNFYQKRLTGVASGATAIVEDYVTRNIRGRQVHLFFLSNIVGEFQIYEPVVYDGLDQFSAPYIYGSVGDIALTPGVPGSVVGDRFDADVGSGSGAELVCRVNQVEGIGNTSVSFSISDGGFGYTIEGSVVEVFGGAILTEDDVYLLADEDDDYLDVVFFGTGASFEVSQISNTSVVENDVVIIAPYEVDALTDYTFKYNLELMTEDEQGIQTEQGRNWVVTDHAAGPTMNDDVTISDWEGLIDVTVGTITAIRVVDAGSGYIDDVTVVVQDPEIFGLSIDDGSGTGKVYGDDAVIVGTVVFGTNVATSLSIFDSGFGYKSGDRVTFHYGENNILTDETRIPLLCENGDSLYWAKTDADMLTGIVSLTAVGHGVGDWVDTRGFLNADKYVQDSFYYQEYSYEIQASQSLDRYEDVVRAVYHPAGVELFGKAMINVDTGERMSMTIDVGPWEMDSNTGLITCSGTISSVSWNSWPHDELRVYSIDNPGPYNQVIDWNNNHMYVIGGYANSSTVGAFNVGAIDLDTMTVTAEVHVPTNTGLLHSSNNYQDASGFVRPQVIDGTDWLVGTIEGPRPSTNICGRYIAAVNRVDGTLVVLNPDDYPRGLPDGSAGNTTSHGWHQPYALFSMQSATGANSSVVVFSLEDDGFGDNVEGAQLAVIRVNHSDGALTFVGYGDFGEPPTDVTNSAGFETYPWAICPGRVTNTFCEFYYAHAKLTDSDDARNYTRYFYRVVVPATATNYADITYNHVYTLNINDRYPYFVHDPALDIGPGNPGLLNGFSSGASSYPMYFCDVNNTLVLSYAVGNDALTPKRTGCIQTILMDVTQTGVAAPGVLTDVPIILRSSMILPTTNWYNAPLMCGSDWKRTQSVPATQFVDVDGNVVTQMDDGDTYIVDLATLDVSPWVPANTVFDADNFPGTLWNNDTAAFRHYDLLHCTVYTNESSYDNLGSGQAEFTKLVFGP